MIKPKPVKLQHSEPQTLGEALLMAAAFVFFISLPFGVGVLAALIFK